MNTASIASILNIAGELISGLYEESQNLSKRFNSSSLEIGRVIIDAARRSGCAENMAIVNNRGKKPLGGTDTKAHSWVADQIAEARGYSSEYLKQCSRRYLERLMQFCFENQIDAPQYRSGGVLIIDIAGELPKLDSWRPALTDKTQSALRELSQDILSTYELYAFEENSAGSRAAIGKMIFDFASSDEFRSEISAMKEKPEAVRCAWIVRELVYISNLPFSMTELECLSRPFCRDNSHKRDKRTITRNELRAEGAAVNALETDAVETPSRESASRAWRLTFQDSKGETCIIYVAIDSKIEAVLNGCAAHLSRTENMRIKGLPMISSPRVSI